MYDESSFEASKDPSAKALTVMSETSTVISEALTVMSEALTVIPEDADNMLSEATDNTLSKVTYCSWYWILLIEVPLL